ncbi:MAG: hypothetical protein KC593_24510 [Myxococcales bacterium]|nr:hypothetical protein [Myxococcales bacterium]MCB9627185.1 hypothetical protein [Sandaracinaceae bacterium]
MTHSADAESERLFRAARYAQFPDVRRAAAAARFGVSLGALRRAIRELGLTCRPRLGDYVLHTLTRGGTVTAGPLPELDSVARYLDYVNKDGSRPEDVARLLEELTREGMIELEGDRWRLLGEFP